MTTITEDYVSFETAKLLKEKGFIEDCLVYYNKVGDLVEETYKFNWNFQTIDYSAPTLQMAMKWLRIEHNIHFIFDPYLDDKYNVKYFIVIVFGNNVVEPVYKTDGDFTYEQAVEAAIKYCLENLI